MSTPAFRLVHLAMLTVAMILKSHLTKGDEAATRDKIVTRIKRYPEGFLCMGVERRSYWFHQRRLRVLGSRYV